MASADMTGAALYRTIWRWHFYAALWTAPLLIVLTLTGVIYLFDRELDGWCWVGRLPTASRCAKGDVVVGLTRGSRPWNRLRV